MGISSAERTLHGVELEQALKSAFEDIVRCYTYPDCAPLLCTIDPVAKEGDVRIMQLAAHWDEDIVEDRENFTQAQVINNLGDTFNEARLDTKIDDEGLKLLLPTVKDIQKFFDVYELLAKNGAFEFNR